MLGSLNVAQSGLKASQTQVENVMNNIANENTAGYKKRVVDTSEAAHIDDRVTGRGISVEGVSRTTDIYMYQNLVEETSKDSSIKELDIMLEDIESIFYETDDSGLSADLNRYFQSIENLKTSPYNEIYRNDLKNNANILIDSIQTVYENIEARENTTIETAKDMVEEANNILKSIGDVNAQITNSVVVSNDLLDKRDMLEKELAQYVDVEISRDINYELKAAGVTAVRFDTNIHTLSLAEEYQAQKDIYVDEGTMTTSSLIDVTTWGVGGDQTSEIQTITISGESDGQVSFLGSLVAGSIAGDDETTTALNIEADAANIIAQWNNEHPKQEISSITAAGNVLTITYVNSEGDVEPIDPSQSEGVSFAKSIETTKGILDKVTYTLNDTVSVDVTYGESITMDWNGDGIQTVGTVDETNVIRALVYKINSLSDTGGKITAYNGDYTLDKDGDKVFKTPLDEDHYLVIESNFPGEIGKFTGEVTVSDSSAASTAVRMEINKNSTLSKDALDDIHLNIYDEEVTVSAGMLKSMIDNIQTESENNYYLQYKERLDNFAKSLVDLSNSFIENDDSYIYGTNAVNIDENYDSRVDIGLFKGSDVKSLTFNVNMVNTLDQQKLDYLSTLQWKDDIDFDGTGENVTTFSKYYQELRVNIADDRENVVFKREAQTAVTESLQKTYDKLTKVDKDEQMIDLIKFQSAYEANAKLITVVDEMLKTLLGMKS